MKVFEIKATSKKAPSFLSVKILELNFWLSKPFLLAKQILKCHSDEQCNK